PAAGRRAAPTGTAFSDAPVASAPDGLVEREICVLSGMPANPWCPSRQREHVPASDDEAPCSWHHLGDAGLVTVWPAKYQEWARKSGLLAGPTQQASAIVVRRVRGTS